MRNPFLIGERVYLRPYEIDDAPRAMAWMNDREVTRTLETRGPINLEQEQEFIRNSIGPTSIALAIVLKDDDRLIGSSGFNTIDHPSRMGTFGIVIGEKELWGQGIGTEVTRLVCHYGFMDLNLNRIELEVFADNIGGIAVYERVGFVREGVRREARVRDGEVIDSLMMSMLRPEWDARYGD
jgi:RimJ/RimL family protein N-acetyltransferase